MKSKKIGSKIIVRIDKGEEIVESISKICKQYQIKIGSVIGIGATNEVIIGLFDVDSKTYHSEKFMGNYEIAPLTGNITMQNEKPYLHIHINVCDKNHHSYGGHLNSAKVSATCECIIDMIDGEVSRIFDEETGLNLLQF